LEISEKNLDGCRPFLEYSWHVEGPPVDSKEDQMLIKRGTQGNTLSLEALCKRYQEKLKHNPNYYTGFTVNSTNKVGPMSSSTTRTVVFKIYQHGVLLSKGI
jgi:hypothetical protein